jgi:hypothetical protein
MTNILKKIAGLFRPKPDATEVALNLIPTALQAQLVLADSSKTTAASLLKDNYALGYIFGYHDAVLQGLKVDNQTTCLAIMGVSYDTIFGGVDNAAPLLRRSLNLQNDEIFRKGMIKGGREAMAFFREEKIPFGLSEWLS